MTIRRIKLSPKELEAQRIELREAERQTARLMRDRLRQLKRIPARDRPLIARNLGRMVESAWPGEARRRAVELFATAYPGNEASYVKKRARYMRFVDEALPERVGYGAYAASGATFLTLAEAHAIRRHGERDEDAKLRAVLGLLEGTSLDRRGARGARDDIEARQCVTRILNRIRDDVLRDVDLTLVFETFAKYPLWEHCALAEAVRLPMDEDEMELLAGDVAKLGYDLAALRSMDPASLEREVAGKTVPRNWRFMRALDPCRLAIDPETWRLEPEKLVAGTMIGDLHRSVPRLKIGTAYLPGIAPCIELDIDPKTLLALPEEAARMAFETACEAVLGPGSRDALAHELDELWSAARHRPVRPAHERLFWVRIPLYLLLAPLGTPDNGGICLWGPTVGEGTAFLAEVGACLEQDRRLDDLFSEDVLHERDKIIWFKDGKTVWPTYDDFYDSLLTGQDANGLDFLLGQGVHLIDRGLPRVTVEDVAEGRCRALVRLAFEDPYEHATPLPHDSLAAAITRNERFAHPGRRLSRQLAAEAQRYVRLVMDFLTEERERFEQAW